VNGQPGIRDHWDLAYQRSWNTMKYLIDELNIEPSRVRLSVAGANEPLHIGTDEERLQDNPRVEIFLLDEVVNDLAGTASEQTKRYADAADSPTPDSP
jgi:chemotaxis protein MotB